MFILGATGQLITLLLSVLLPFMFLISGQREIETPQTIKIVKVEQSQAKILTFQYSSDTQDTNVLKTEQKSSNLYVNYFTELIFQPDQNSLIRKLTFTLNGSGNNSPPTFSLLLC